MSIEEYIAEEFEHTDCNVQIIQYWDAQDPRKFFDNVGTMVFLNRRDYPTGDEPSVADTDDLLTVLASALLPAERLEAYEAWLEYEEPFLDGEPLEIYNARARAKYDTEREAWLTECHKHGIVIYLDFRDYGSGGCRLIMQSEFDNCDGVVYASTTRILQEWPTDTETQARKYLEGEVETYNQYVSGDVWGFVVKHKTYDISESVWGFYGIDTCREEAKSEAEGIAAEVQKDLVGTIHRQAYIAYEKRASKKTP